MSVSRAIFKVKKLQNQLMLMVQNLNGEVERYLRDIKKAFDKQMTEVCLYFLVVYFLCLSKQNFYCKEKTIASI